MPRDGRVAQRAPGWDPSGYGYRVWVTYEDGVDAVFGHLQDGSDDGLGSGDLLSEGQQIGRLGNTGESSGPHLHYGEYVGGVPREPVDVECAYGA